MTPTTKGPDAFVCRTALVTGGGSGIGRAVVAALGERDAKTRVQTLGIDGRAKPGGAASRYQNVHFTHGFHPRFSAGRRLKFPLRRQLE